MASVLQTAASTVAQQVVGMFTSERMDTFEGFAKSLTVRQEEEDVVLRDSGAVSFFRGFSRFGQPKEFEPSEDYVRGVIYTGIPWLCLGAVMSLAAFVMIIVRFTCLRDFFDECDEFWSASTKKRRVIQGFVSVLLVQGSLACAAVAFMANYTIREQTQVVIDWVVATSDTVVTVLSVGLVVFEFLARQVENFVLFRIQRVDAISSTTEFQQLLEDLPLTALRVTREIETTTRNVVDSLTTVSDVVEVASLILFIVIISLIAFTMFGPLFMTCYTMTRSKYLRVCALLLFLLPLIVAWIFLAASVIIGVAASDVCHMTTDFAVALRFANGDSSQEPSSDFNYIAQELTCPSVENLQEPFEDVKATFEQIRNEVSASTGVQIGVLDELFAEITSQFTDLSTCGIVLTFMERWFGWLCDGSVNSVANAVFALFLAYLIMCILMSAMYLVALFGMDLSTYATLWPIWKPDSAADDDDNDDVISDELYAKHVRGGGEDADWIEQQYEQDFAQQQQQQQHQHEAAYGDVAGYPQYDEHQETHGEHENAPYNAGAHEEYGNGSAASPHGDAAAYDEHEEGGAPAVEPPPAMYPLDTQVPKWENWS
eukprot:CAMPEP_0185854234 /NCGR_PEP_ID=MMETSP1354-20130828/21725_1 /TAXON_ID=708628 /ORGANISM="Erythrolobus madagascarensis, Strain CCMP3276" /LENGTH=598 /DNA_ID=CAMNT_0028555945 /DNA_START=180 /DNA_END=1979 /DNA_ORIENTATION=-